MRVGTYPTRDFATLGPLELRPPFTGASFPSFSPKGDSIPLPCVLSEAVYSLPPEMTRPLNLPALGRRQSLYLGFLLGRDLGFR